MTSFRFPTAHSTLLIIAVLVALLTWILPSGEFDRLTYQESSKQFVVSGSKPATLPGTQETLNTLGISISLEKFVNGDIWKPIGIPGTYHFTESKPQGFLNLVQAPLKGITQAFDVILFVLILGGAIGVVNSSGAFDSGVASLSRLLKGKEYLLIILITSLIAAGGTTFGLAEETIAFYPILVPVFLAAGYDAMVAIACIYIGSSIGTMASTVNPFSTIIASDTAGINWITGINSRITFLFIGLAVCLSYILRYARKVRKDPSLSIIADQKSEIEAAFIRADLSEAPALTNRQKLILALFTSCFVLMIYGVSSLEWWFLEMTTVFFAGAVCIGFVQGAGERTFVKSFVSGSADLLSVALIIGIARGITVLMEQGQISDTLLYYSSVAVDGMPKPLFINLLYFLYIGLALFISSSSGMAVLTMPVFAPLADVVGIDREIIVNAYQFGQGVFAFISPTGLILASLTVVNVGYNKWLRFVLPLVGILFLMAMISLTLSVIL